MLIDSYALRIRNRNCDYEGLNYYVTLEVIKNGVIYKRELK